MAEATSKHPAGRCTSIQCVRCFPELGRAKVRFWSCPDHLGAPHRVEWRGDVAHCLTCGNRSDLCPVHREPWVVPDAPDGHRRTPASHRDLIVTY